MAVAATIIIGRAISALREWMAQIGSHGRVAVSMIGKIKTTAQMIAVLLLLYREPLGGFFPTLAMGQGLLLIAAALTLWSMLHYLIGGMAGARKGLDDPVFCDNMTGSSRRE